MLIGLARALLLLFWPANNKLDYEIIEKDKVDCSWFVDNELSMI